MAQTVNQIIQAALRLLLVKDANNATLTTAEAADGLQALNELIEEMNLQSLFPDGQDSDYPGYNAK